MSADFPQETLAFLEFDLFMVADVDCAPEGETFRDCAPSRRWKRESLVFGERHDGTIAHIEDDNLPFGKACGCKCPGCGTPLIARTRGKIRAKCFAHEANFGDRCEVAQETALHKFAKEVAAREKRIRVPGLSVTDGLRSLVIVSGGIVQFEAAAVECRVGDVIPDVILSREGEEVLVEMFVTHLCDESKAEKLKCLNASTLEIDLSSQSRDVSKSGLTKLILEDAPRKWVHHRLHADGLQRLERLRDEESAIRIARISDVAKRYKNHVEQLQTIAPSFGSLKAIGNELGFVVGIDVLGAGHFSVPTDVWQAQLLTDMTLMYVAGTRRLEDVETALKKLHSRNMLNTEYEHLTQSEFNDVCAIEPSFSSPGAAILEWVRACEKRKVFNTTSAGEWTLASAFARNTPAARHYVASLSNDVKSDRLYQIRSIVFEWIRKLPIEESQTFDFERWANELIVSHGEGAMFSMNNACAFGEIDFQGVRTSLRDYLIAIFNNKPASLGNLGLPLDAEIMRRSARANQTKSAAELLRQAESTDPVIDSIWDKADRQRRLKDAAHEALGSNADKWLNSIYEEFLLTPLEFVLKGKTALQIAIEKLNLEARKITAINQCISDDSEELPVVLKETTGSSVARRPSLGKGRRRL